VIFEWVLANKNALIIFYRLINNWTENVIWKIKEEFVPLYFRKRKDLLGLQTLVYSNKKTKSGSFSA
jgi:hypothetical protein